MLKEINELITITDGTMDKQPIILTEGNPFSIQVFYTGNPTLNLLHSLQEKGPYAIVQDSEVVLTDADDSTIFNVFGMGKGSFIKVNASTGSGTITKILYRS